MTTQPESKRYSRELKRQSPQQSRNFEPHPIHLVAQEPRRVAQRLQSDPRPYKQVRFLEQPSPPQPRNQQVCFLLHPCLKERHQQYLDLPPAPFRPPDRLLPHFQRHRLHHQDLIHLTHQQSRPWLNRTNLPILLGTPQIHMTDPPRRQLPFGIPSPVITPLTRTSTPLKATKWWQPLPTSNSVTQPVNGPVIKWPQPSDRTHQILGIGTRLSINSTNTSFYPKYRTTQSRNNMTLL